MASAPPAALFTRLQQLIRGPSCWLVAAAVSTTLGHGPRFMAPLLDRACEGLPEFDATKPLPMPTRARDDPAARRLVFRQLKEAIVCGSDWPNCSADVSAR